MKRISYILTIVTVLVVITAGCRKQRPDSDPDAWKYDLSLPVPINFGDLSAQTKGEAVISLDGKYLGIFALEHGDSTLVDWSAGSSNVLLNNVTGTKDGENISFYGGPYYYPVDNHRNFSFYGYYPTTYENGSVVSISRKHSSMIVRMQIKDNVDILWAYSLATTKNVDGTSYSGFNGRYIRKVALSDSDCLPKLDFKHVTTNLVFNAKAHPALTEEQFAKFGELNFQITGIKITPITNGSVIKKIPRYADLYVATEVSSLSLSSGALTGESSDGHKPGDLVPVINEGDGGFLSIEKSAGNYLSILGEDGSGEYQSAEIGSFFMVPFTGEVSDIMNVEITYNIGTEGNVTSNILKAQIGIGGKEFEAGKRYVYNILFYPPEEATVGVSDPPAWVSEGEEEDVNL